MKKLIYILIGVFTFSVSFWLFQLRPIVVPVSLCEISQHSELFQSKQLRVKAFLDNVRIDEDGREDFSVSDFRKGCVTGATLEISEELKAQLKSDESFQNFIMELRQKNDEIYKKRDGNGLFVAEIEIVGEIRKVEEPENASIVSPPPYIISANEIKQVSSIRFISREELSVFIKSTKF